MNPSTETSGKPADIPSDVWDGAAKYADEYARWLHAGNSTGVLSDHAEQGLTDTIARAILAERARCAHIAFCAYDRKTEICSRIVRKIRSGVER